MQNMINKTHEYLWEHLSSSSAQAYDIDYRFEHSLRVAHIGLKIAEAENANKKVVVLGCLLHDLGKFDSERGVDHGRVSAKLARPYLESLDLSQKEVDDICFGIASHVDGKAGYEYEDILEARIITDSDNIDRFSSAKIHQSKLWDMEDSRSKDEKIQAYQSLVTKWRGYLNQSPLLTETGSALFQDKVKLSLHFYETLIEDLKITCPPSM